MMAPMAMMASPAAPPTALRDAALTGEERTLAAFLQKDIVDAFERTRGSEQRVVVYLALQKVLRLEDTHGSVRVLQRHLPTLLHVVHHDLQHATMQDLVHVALRTLSYFMHHPTLARGFRDDQVESFLTDIMSRLGSTQDEATYKVCLWCLIVQDLDLSRLDFLPRIVEALVLAIINPFQSRPIAVQTLKGLHLLLYKNQHFMLRASTLRLWFKPVASRLGSSDKTTRDLAALVLLEAATGYHDPQRDEPASEETDKEIAAALTEYALPAIQTHVTHERRVDALIVWKIVMMLMKRMLATDLPLLDSLLSVPETSMVHADASVRLHGVEAWRHLVEVFRQTKDWLFKKPVLVMLMRPIVACLEEESMLNILHAALATWRVLLTAVVEDFNEYAQSQRDSAVVMQESAKKWRRWVDEVVKKVVAVAAERAQRPVHADAPEMSFEALYDTVETTVRDLFTPLVVGGAVAAPVDGKTTSVPSNTRGSESSLTTAASSASGGFESQAPERRRSAMDLSERDDQILDDELLEHSLSAMHSSQASQHAPPVSCPALSGHLVVLALSISDVLALVQKLYQISNHAATLSGRIDVGRRSESLAFYVWDGLCTRLKLASATGHDDAIDKLRLRVTRMALDFSFGTAASGVPTSSMDSQASVLMPSLPMDSLMTAADLIHSSSLRLQGNQGSLPFRWQLQLLREIIDTTTSADELAAMLVHPKIKTSHHLLTRIDGIAEHDTVYRVWLAQWDQAAAAPKDGEKERLVDFSAKKNVALCVLLYVVMKLAVTFDEADAFPSTDTLGQMAKDAEEVIKAVAACVSPTKGSSSESVASFLRIVESSSRAASLLLDRDSDADVTGPGKLLKMCARLAHRSEETQENAEVLLQLQRSPVREVTFVSASPISTPVRSTISTASAVAPSPEPTQAGAPGLSDGSSLPSPCLLQPAKATVRVTSQEQSVKMGSLSPTRPSSVTVAVPTTPQTPSRAIKAPPRAATTPSRQTTGTPVASAASTAMAATPVAPAQGSVFPDLVSCTDPFTNLQHHFPASFRKLAPLHNIKTVGDLSAMTLAQVMKLGIKDPATTVMKALADYHTRKSRPKPSSAAINSPYQPRFSSPPGTTTPGLPSPSPKRIQKRPIASPHNRLVVTPLPLESPQRKRARRTLHELSSELDQDETKQDGTSGLQTLDSEATNELPKIANRVTFRLDLGDGGTKFTRPGEESQEAPKSVANGDEEKESAAERMQMYVFKMRHHLSRTLSYAEKIGAEENSMQSETSLQADVNKLGKMMQQMVEAHALVTRIGTQLLRVSEEVERAHDARKRNLDVLQPPQ